MSPKSLRHMYNENYLQLGGGKQKQFNQSR